MKKRKYNGVEKKNSVLVIVVSRHRRRRRCVMQKKCFHFSEQIHVFQINQKMKKNRLILLGKNFKEKYEMNCFFQSSFVAYGKRCYRTMKRIRQPNQFAFVQLH
jgi:hypothetical protein